MALASGVLTIIIIIYSMFRKIFSFDYWHSKDVPYLEPSVPFGNIKDVWKKFHIIQVIAKAYDKFKNTGAKYCGVYFWARPVAVILDLDLVDNILVKDSSNFMDKGYQNENCSLLSANLLMVDGDNWEKLRKKFTPTFVSSKMKSLFPTVLGIGDCLRSTLMEMISQKENVIDIGDLMTRYTSDIFGNCIFGIECNSLQNKNCDFLQKTKKATNPPRHRDLIHIIQTVFKNIARKLRIKLWRDDVEDYFVNVTKDTIEYREKNLDVKRNDMMDILLNLKNDLNSGNVDITTNEIVANLFGFLLAGFESSSNTLTFCIYHLAKDICIQTRARHELESLYEKYGGKITYEMLLNMPFIDKVIQGKVFCFHSDVFQVFFVFIFIYDQKSFLLCRNTSSASSRSHIKPSSIE